MSQINEPETVRSQYGTTERLTQRISIHEKDSSNKIEFSPWIVSHYDFPEGGRVLELGCGTGRMWKGQEALIRRCSVQILTDLIVEALCKILAPLGVMGLQKEYGLFIAYR